MKCRICGAKLKKDGDICNICYKEFQEEEDLKKDTNQKLCVKRKYLISYEITKRLELIIVFILALLLCLLSGGILEGLAVIAVGILVIGLFLAYSKRAAMGTQIIFYEKKVVFIKKYLFFNEEKTIKYSDIRDVTYFQTFRQKKFKLGDLCIYTKETIPGLGYFNGCHISNIENTDEVLSQIVQLVGPIEE